MSKAALETLKAVNYDVTQEALVKNVNEDLQKVAQEESEKQLAEWEANQKRAQIEADDDEFDDLDDDPVLAQLQQKRLDELKSMQQMEKQFHAQGHGEYREIVEDEFLKEVCGSPYVVIHFFHPEFFNCKVVDKHLRLLAPKHLACKFLTLNAEKAPFFVTKLHIQVLPTVIVFRRRGCRAARWAGRAGGEAGFPDGGARVVALEAGVHQDLKGQGGQGAPPRIR